MGEIKFDIFDGSITYRCKCGRTVSLTAEDLIPDQAIDYCGCGLEVHLFRRDTVADHRKFAKLPDLPE